MTNSKISWTPVFTGVTTSYEAVNFIIRNSLVASGAAVGG
jgi:hypothetical protein